MSVLVLRADAGRLPLSDESVDLIITSPPYFALRSYRDGDEHYDGQIGSEPTPQAFLEALWAVTAECWRVLKPTGSMWVNLGDKRAGSGGHNNAGFSTGNLGKDRMRSSTLAGGLGRAQEAHEGGDRARAARLAGAGRSSDDTRASRATRRNAPDRYNQECFGRAKSKMLLPHRYAIGCEDGLADPDGLGWIVRQDQVWWKPNGLPESTDDRTRDSHEYWFLLTKQGDYFADIDRIRQPQSESSVSRVGGRGGARPDSDRARYPGATKERWSSPEIRLDPLGSVPPSVWSIPTEPLRVPDYFVDDPVCGWQALDAEHVWRLAGLRHAEGLPLPVTQVDHFAAFPTEWPRRLVLGWSPSGICTACGQGRTTTTTTTYTKLWNHAPKRPAANHDNNLETFSAKGRGYNEHHIVGEACACTLEQWTPPPTRPAVVLDPFSGTGTTAAVAHALGRNAIAVDLSMDYCRLAKWRVGDPSVAAKVRGRTNQAAQLGLAFDADPVRAIAELACVDTLDGGAS